MVTTPPAARSIADLGEETSSLLDELSATGEPVVLTRDGQDVAVILSIEQYRALRGDLDEALMSAVSEAEADVAAGRTRDHDEVASRLRRWAGRGA